MNSEKGGHIWATLRVYVLSACVIAMVAAIVYSQAHTVDIEGPSGEAMIAERDYNNQQNQEAFERVTQDPDRERPGDFEKGSEYIRDNVV